MNVVKLKSEKMTREIKEQGFHLRLYHDAVVVLKLGEL